MLSEILLDVGVLDVEEALMLLALLFVGPSPSSSEAYSFPCFRCEAACSSVSASGKAGDMA